MKIFPVITAVAAAALLATPAAAQSLADAVAKDADYLHALYVDLHEHPEISFQEEKTSAHLAAELRGLGFEVTEGVGGYGIVGVMKNGDGPTLLIRTDMDALPVPEQTGLPYASHATTVDDDGNTVPIMHACGHDVHMTVFVGTARRMAALTDQWAGTLIMIGQPAEERGGGAKAMIDDGLFTRFPRPDYNMALHDSASLPAGDVGYASGYALANVDSVDILVKGIGGHGAYPQTTKDPVVLAAEIVLALQTLVSREVSPQEPAVVTVGSIHGGTKRNIISGEVRLQLTVRSYSDGVRAQLLDGIERIAKNAGRMAGLPEDMLPVVTQEDTFTPSTYNTPELAQRAAAAIAAEIGQDHVYQLDAVMGGEDFGRYGRVDPPIPSFIYWLGAVDPAKYAQAQAGKIKLPSLHSPKFAPVQEPTISIGVRAMTAAALDLLGKN